MKKQLETDKDFIRTELEKLKIDNDVPTADAMRREEIAANFRESWQGLTAEEKRLFLTKHVKKIILRNDPVEGNRVGIAKVVNVEFNAY